jgi:hypothetical protein
MIALSATTMGAGPSVRQLAAGAARVYCLIPDWCEGTARRVADIYIRRAAAREGLGKVHVRWQWCRESEDGEGETVFLVELAESRRILAGA